MTVSSYLLANDLRLHYLQWNFAAAGQPLVLLHGLASNARIWEQTAPHLAEAGFSVTAPDLRGHGQTDKPDGNYSFETFARDLAAFLGGLRLEKPVLVGHSWGAMLALDYAARTPVGPFAPAGIALVDGGMVQMDAFGQTWEQMRERLTPPRLAGMAVEDFLARLETPNPRWQPDDRAVPVILANFEISADETITPRLSFEHHMQIVRAMWEFQTYARFEQVRCPALLLPARPAPPYTPAEAEFLAWKQAGVQEILSRSPRARLEWLDDTIHDAPLQRPQDLAGRLARFAAAAGGRL